MSLANNTGGAIVRENLCKILRELGHDAKIIMPQVGSNSNKRPYFLSFLKYMFTTRARATVTGKLFNIKGCKLKLTPFVDEETIVVYPQLTFGNPLKAKNVVRWFLHYNPHIDNSKAFGENDLFFTYREVFNDYSLNPTCMKLTTPYFDFDLYKRTNFGDRKGNCYIIRKGELREDLPKEFDGPIIDNLPEEEKVRIMNECEYCISYDTQTAYSSIAALCGCISVVVPEPGKSRGDYIKEGDSHNSLGRAYGFSEEEIAYARSTMDKIRESYEQKNNESVEQVRNFVEVCKEYFKL
jgi:hypothetical protein